MLSLKQVQTKFFSDIINPSTNVADYLTPESKIAVYQQAYIIRLIEVLESHLPITAWTMGKQVFSEFAKAYFQDYPPTSYRLSDLSKNILTFAQKSGKYFQPWSNDVLEHDLKVFYSGNQPAKTPLQTESLQTVPPDHWSFASLEFQPFVFLQKTNWSVQNLREHYLLKKEFTAALATESPDYFVFHRSVTGETLVSRISEREFLVLEDFYKGTSFGLIGEIHSERVTSEDLFDWLQNWQALQLISGVRFLIESA